MVVVAQHDIVNITQDVVEAINAQEWETGFTASRGYLTIHDLKAMGAGVVVKARPESLDDGEETRAGRWENWGVSVCIARKLDVGDDAAIDELVRLELAMREYFQRTQRIGEATVDGVELGGGTGMLYEPQLLHQTNIFVGSVTLTLATR